MSNPATPGETLAQLVKRIRTVDNNWSLLDVVRHADQSGKKISDSYVSMIENGIITNPSPKILKALAAGLRLAPEVLSQIVFGGTATLSEQEQVLLANFRRGDKRAQADLVKISVALADEGPKPSPIKDSQKIESADVIKETAPNRKDDTSVGRKTTKPSSKRK